MHLRRFVSQEHFGDIQVSQKDLFLDKDGIDDAHIVDANIQYVPDAEKDDKPEEEAAEKDSGNSTRIFIDA